MSDNREIVGISDVYAAAKRQTLLARRQEFIDMILEDIELVPNSFTDREFDTLVASDSRLEQLVENYGGSPYMPAETYEEMAELLGDEN